MSRIKCGVLAVLAIGAITGCWHHSNKDSRPETESSIRIGDQTVSQADIDLETQSLDPQLRSRNETESGRLDIKRSVIDRTVLAYEARVQGLDKQPAVKKQVDGILSRKLLEIEVNKRFTEAEAERLYQANKDKFKSEKVHLAQILIRIKADDGANAEKKAKARAEKLLSQLKSGSSFEQTARKYSDDQISAVKGGDLGEVTPGRLPAPLDDVARKLQAGGLSDVLQTPMGFHVLKAIEPLKAQTRPIDDVKPLLKTMFENEVNKTLLRELRAKYRVPESDGKRE